MYNSRKINKILGNNKMAHDHHHHHSHMDETNEKNIRVAFFLNFGFALIEIVGGYFTNSIAIMADALHDLGDSITLAISWRLEKLAQKEGDRKFSYGYKRFSLLSALIGAIILLAGIVFVLFESINRILEPQTSNARGMLVLAVLGIAANGIAALRAGKGKNLNSRMIYWHLMEDAMGWAAVLFVSIVLLFWDIKILDPILSIMVSAFILFNVVKNLKQTIKLFLQGVPAEIDSAKIEEIILSDEKVIDVHHVHIWSLDGEHHVLTMHIVLRLETKKEDIRRIKQRVKNVSEQFDLSHTTIEFEYQESDCSMSK